jgi:hypothetical protein
MTFDEQEILGRFHRALVREIRAKDPDHITSPFTVAEIYQNLVPYRTHRDEIGVEMNADYEHALLRLLAGDGGYLSIESRTARQEIREELESPNPNTGLYRDFAAADVRLNPDKLDDGLLEGLAEEEPTTSIDDAPLELDSLVDEVGEPGMVDDGTENEPFERLEVEPLGASLGPIDDQEPPEEVDSEEYPVELSDEEGDFVIEGEEVSDVEPVQEVESVEEEEQFAHPENCPWCRESLPQQTGVKFCPFCGSNVQLVPCPSCGEELRINWRFCIACGTEVES